MRSCALPLAFVLMPWLGLEAQANGGVGSSNQSLGVGATISYTLLRISGAFDPRGQWVSDGDGRPETKHQTSGDDDNTSTGRYYCSVPMTGAAPSENMELRCARFKDQQSCLTYCNVDEFPGRCVWINEQYWKNVAPLP